MERTRVARSRAGISSIAIVRATRESFLLKELLSLACAVPFSLRIDSRESTVKENAGV